MKTEIENTVQILSDLVKINNDRIAGYHKAVGEVKDFELKNVFQTLADESKRNASDLAREIRKQGGPPDPAGTTAAGKIYRAWMDIKYNFTGHDRKSVLNSCEYGEDAAQKAYKEGIASNDLPGDVRQMLRNQQIALKNSHDAIKNLRNGNHNVIYSF